MRFLNRIQERKRLTDAFLREESSLIVIYGRRRCGKSRLIREVLSSDDVYFMADKSESIQQRALLSKEISKVVPGFDRINYQDWDILFETLNYRLKKRFTICLDEFPYLVKSTPELPSIIQKWTDNKENLNFNLILCGSSQQMMYSLVFDSSEPLYGRADEILKIEPLDIRYLKEAIACTPIRAVEEYSVWGGVPRYWELRNNQSDLFEAIKYHVFSSKGVLYDEPIRLFLDDMRDSVQPFTILSLIAAGCNRLSEIAARLGKPATNLSNPLDKLISLGYIEREIPFGENVKNSKKSLYKISDPFLRFYFHYVVPNRSAIESENIEKIITGIRNNFNDYVSLQWERCCRDYVRKNQINGITFENVSRWWGNIDKSNQVEFDVVALSEDNKTLLVGECKWSDSEINEEKLLIEISEKAKKMPSASNKKIIPVLFLKQSKHKVENVFFPEDIL